MDPLFKTLFHPFNILKPWSESELFFKLSPQCTLGVAVWHPMGVAAQSGTQWAWSLNLVHNGSGRKMWCTMAVAVYSGVQWAWAHSLVHNGRGRTVWHTTGVAAKSGAQWAWPLNMAHSGCGR
uniref:Uncharacterized protein n=1 Tax=Engystomops pustulosus TaxID=76066 RepID=A0AAV6YWQ5_ENGPU|nr:hypothetical protein GDO81_022672 [Engystomops pustulosus]